MSPRKSSTSSARPGRPRPRYLGLEVAGEHFPSLAPRAWENLLTDRLASAGVTVRRFRLIRSEGRRAIAEVDHRAAVRARAAWSAPPTDPNAPALVPYRTWGTLVGAKAWLRGRRDPGRTSGR